MLRLLERNVASVQERLVLLAPPQATLSGFNVTASPTRHSELLGELQRLRGRIYKADGAVQAQDLSPDGRHQTPEDQNSWHVMIMNERNQVSGCIWYLEHETIPTLEELRVRSCPLIRQTKWRSKLRAAVESDMASARQQGIGYAEVGGWAVAKEGRLSDCLLLLLGTYGLSQIVGGAFVIATATVRHSSAAILRRMGGSPFESDGLIIPPYYDTHYKCDMELLRFDTRQPSRKFVRLVDLLRDKLLSVPVISAAGAAVEWASYQASESVPFRGWASPGQQPLAVA